MTDREPTQAEIQANERTYALALNEGERSLLSPFECKLYDAVQARLVFGADHKKDENGHPIEQGFGSPSKRNGNHWAALRKAEQMGLEAPGTTARLMAEAKGVKPAVVMTTNPVIKPEPSK